MSIIEAIKFAAVKHCDQKRKYTGEPYIIHPLNVLSLADEHCPSYYDKELVSVAAVLHDVLEDTDTTEGEISDRFGYEILSLVLGLTDISKPEDGNRAARKAIDREHLLRQPEDIQFIKCADLIDNARDDKGFAKIYLQEKRLLLDGMKKNSLKDLTEEVYRESVEMLDEGVIYE